MERREFRLREALASMADDFQYIIVDCPPSLGLLTLNALTAADALLVPIQCEYYALEGVTELFDTLARIRRLHNPSLTIEGLLHLPDHVGDVQGFFEQCYRFAPGSTLAGGTTEIQRNLIAQRSLGLPRGS